MSSSDIVSYIQAERTKGTPDATIRSNLLGNGWSEKDVSEAFQGHLAVTMSHTDLKKYRLKRRLATFVILGAIDVFLIKILGGSGIFGLSAISIVLRILVIYGIAYASAQGTKPVTNPWMDAGATVVRTVGVVAVVLVVGFGVFFLYCTYSLSHSSI